LHRGGQLPLQEPPAVFEKADRFCDAVGSFRFLRCVPVHAEICTDVSQDNHAALPSLPTASDTQTKPAPDAPTAEALQEMLYSDDSDSDGEQSLGPSDEFSFLSCEGSKILHVDGGDGQPLCRCFAKGRFLQVDRPSAAYRTCKRPACYKVLCQ
jgi:hypothetical protein